MSMLTIFAAMKNNNAIKGILFDLDGTLAHSLPCLLSIINELLLENQLTSISETQLRGYVDCGTETIIKKSFPAQPASIDLKHYQQRLLNTYIQRLAEQTTFYEPLPAFCQHLSLQTIPWGIVTNRPLMMTTP